MLNEKTYVLGKDPSIEATEEFIDAFNSRNPDAMWESGWLFCCAGIGTACNKNQFLEYFREEIGDSTNMHIEVKTEMDVIGRYQNDELASFYRTTEDGEILMEWASQEGILKESDISEVSSVSFYADVVETSSDIEGYKFTVYVFKIKDDYIVGLVED